MTTVWFLVIIGTGIIPMKDVDVCTKAMKNMTYALTFCVNSNSGVVHRWSTIRHP